jgi:hypothetical protein
MNVCCAILSFFCKNTKVFANSQKLYHKFNPLITTAKASISYTTHIKIFFLFVVFQKNATFANKEKAPIPIHERERLR